MSESVRPLAEEIVRYLRDGVNVNLVGVRGSGRSTLINDVVGRLGAIGHSVVRVTGVALLNDRPLAGLAASGLDVGQGSSASVVGAAANTLVRSLASARSVLVADDVDALDRTSLGVIAAAFARHRFAVLTSTQPSSRRHPAVVSLASEIQPTIRINMRPMHFDELHRMVHHILNGTVDSGTVARIATLTGGLPGLVTAVIGTARRTGVLVESDGHWRAETNLYSDRLAEVIEPMLAGVSDEQISALTKIAMLGSVPALDAERIIGREQLSALDDAGLLQVIGSPSAPIVAVFPPLISEYLRRESSAARRLQVYAELEAVGAGTAARNASRISPRRNRPDSMSTVLSSRIREHWQAEARLRRTTWEDAPSAENAIPLLYALHATSADSGEIFEVVEQTAKSKDLWYARMLMWESLYMAIHEQDLAGACRLLRRKKKELPQWGGLFDVSRDHLDFMERRVPASAPAVSDFPDPYVRQVFDAGRVEALLAHGKVLDALAIIESYDPDEPTYVEHGPIFRGLAYLLSGRIDEGIEFSGQQLAKAQDELEPGLIQAYGYVNAFGLALLGRFREVDAVASSILTLMGSTTIYEYFQRGLLTLAALSASWEGRAEYAHRLADQAKAMGKLGPFPAMLAAVAPALIYQRDEAAGSELWEAVAERLDNGYCAAGIFLAAAAVEISPNVELAKRVAEVSKGAQSDILKALGDYTLAASTMDAAKLRKAVEALKETRTAIHILRSGVRLAMALRLQDDAEGAALAADEAWNSPETEESVRRVIFEPLVQMIDLTTREAEISTLVSEGLVPSDIALALDLSVRTVENHITNIYRKVGVGSRLRLQEVMETWLASARSR